MPCEIGCTTAVYKCNCPYVRSKRGLVEIIGPNGKIYYKCISTGLEMEFEEPLEKGFVCTCSIQEMISTKPKK